MTIRAKRAKALPILDKDADWSMGGMVDESLSPDGESYLESLSVFFSGAVAGAECNTVIELKQAQHDAFLPPLS